MSIYIYSEPSILASKNFALYTCLDYQEGHCLTYTLPSRLFSAFKLSSNGNGWAGHRDSIRTDQERC